MRSLIAVCLLAGCYKPSTDSCYYACATQGTACPSGLTCVAGMCSTGEVCDPIGGDGPRIDSGPEIDAPPAVCSNNIVAPGEFCYLSANGFSSTGMPFDGVLADREGDGDLDLIYGTSTGYFANLNTGGVLSTTAVAGPSSSVPPRILRSANIDTSPSVELIYATTNGIETYVYSGSNHVRMGTGTNISPVAFAVANISGGPLTNLAVLTTSEIHVLRYDASYNLSVLDTVPTAGFPAAHLATGKLDGDQRSDVVIGGTGGISTYLGTLSGLAGRAATLMTSRVDNTAVGDINGDGRLDIVFVVTGVSGTSGLLGVMRGLGDGTLGMPTTMPIGDLGRPIDVRDLDGDGRDDVIAVRTGTQRALLILRGRTDGMFEPPVAFPLVGMPAMISARGDYNNDTVPDIVVTDAVTNLVYVFTSNP